jgi:predicted O-methyltransferase YrrM
MLALRREFSLTRFLETGTFDGRTTAWAAQHFEQVVTIEASEELRRSAMEKHAGLRNVRWVHGDTREVLRGEVEGSLDLRSSGSTATGAAVRPMGSAPSAR